MTAKPKRATQAQRIDMYELMKTVITITEKGPTKQENKVEYAEGWDDERVARHISPLLSPASAANLRGEQFGKLRDYRPPKNSNSGLLELIAEQSAEMHDFKVRFNKLISVLHINKVGDLAHLSILKKDGTIT